MNPPMQTCMFGPCAPPDRTLWQDFVRYLSTQNEEYRRQFREKFYSRYSGPVYWCIRRMGIPAPRAEDFTHGFFAKKILDDRQGILERVQAPENWRENPKPRFRYFLATAVRHYVIDRLRREKHRFQPLDPGLLQRPEPEEELSRALTRVLVKESLSETREWYCHAGKEAHWRIFNAWVRQRTGRAKQADWPKLCRDAGISAEPGSKAEKSAQAKCETAKRQFRKILRAKLRVLVASESDIDPELADLVRITLAAEAMCETQPLPCTGPNGHAV